MSMINSGLFTSNDSTWTTPQDFFDKLNDEFHFTLDAAALKSSAKVDNYFGPDHIDPSRRDALKCDWRTAADDWWIWLNPPYGREIKDFMRKADAEAQTGAKIVALVPARTDTAWWHDYVIHHEIQFIRGRLKFGNATNSALFPSALVIMQ